MIGKQRLPDVAGGRAGERDQALGALGLEPARGDFAPAAVLVRQPRPRQKVAQPEVAGA
jgi:hypothetical protein